jgi:hypothetical protein
MMSSHFLPKKQHHWSRWNYLSYYWRCSDRFAKIYSRDFAREIFALKIENVLLKLKNFKTRNRSVYWIKIQLKQKRNLLYSELSNKSFSLDYINSRFSFFKKSKKLICTPNKYVDSTQPTYCNYLLTLQYVNTNDVFPYIKNTMRPHGDIVCSRYIFKINISAIWYGIAILSQVARIT